MTGTTLRRLLFWGAAAFAFGMAAVPRPPDVPGSPDDKVLHVTAFATLALLGAWAYPRARTLTLLAGLSCFGALIEAVQAIPALHRDSELTDWLADTAAAGIVLLGLAWWKSRSKAQR